MTLTEDRVAVVTGGAGGVGAATAALLLEDGYRVAIAGRDPGRLEAAFGALGGDASLLLARPTDVGEQAQAASLVAEAVERFGRLDAVVNAHGVAGNFQPIEKLTEEDWLDVLRTNLLGAIHTATAAIPHLRETKGSVVNVASINAYQGEALMAPYGVSKAGLVAFTKYLAAETARDGVRVNAIAPGWIDTPLAQPFFEELDLVGKPISTNMLQRVSHPREIASVVGFLLSDAASFITAETITADGGHCTLLAPLGEAEAPS